MQPTADSLASVNCTECAREARAGERWHLYFADLGEVAIYCPECAEREFGEPERERPLVE
jgi:hypothetical protein